MRRTVAVTTARELAFDVDEARRVSGLLMLPDGAHALYVLAHGAGAGMAHPFMTTISTELATRGIGTLRYQFPYMEAGSRRPDTPKVAHAAVRAAVAEAGRRAPGLPLIAGGKSFGGRMTSQAEALEHLPGVVGLAFLGFPLHPPGKPGVERADHLADVRIPMLFLQGAQDKLAEPTLLRPLCADLPHATLHEIDHADHSFHVPKRSGRSDDEVMAELVETSAEWIGRFLD